MPGNYAINTTLHQLFEEQAKDTPDALALVDENDSITYSQFNELSDQMALLLMEAGLKREQPVGICLDRNINVVIAIMGVLKAGGAYMPLDPHSPNKRINKILNNSNTDIVIAENSYKTKLSDFDGRLIFLNSYKEDLLPHDNKLSNPEVLPNNLAYIIHTSGSTGEPKGVETEHRPVVNLCQWHKHILRDNSLRTLGFAPLTFDASVQELFTTCCNGGTFFIVSDNLRAFPEKLAKYVSENKIERLIMAYTPLRYLLQAATDLSIDFPALKFVVNVGEPLVISQVFRNFFKKHPSCKLHNQYGLTETAVDMIDYELTDTPDEWLERPPIGRPIVNTNAYILNNDLEPVEKGESGELFVGGICPARGYMNRPDLTKEKFLKDPFSENEESILYKTGDMGKQLPDGNIQCLGRLDNQVKIRGFRVELDEIQIVLLQHKGIKHAVARIWEKEGEEVKLVAYIVCEKSRVPSTFELRTYLSKQLPDYMIPNAFMVLEEFPQTTSGKVDKNALPPPDDLNSQTEYKPAGTDVEQELVSLWQEMLKIERVGVNDDFFVLGGESISAAQLLYKIECNYNVVISLARFYQSPTVAELSSIIELKLKQQKNKQDEMLEQLLDQIENMSENEVKAQLSGIE